MSVCMPVGFPASSFSGSVFGIKRWIGCSTCVMAIWGKQKAVPLDSPGYKLAGSCALKASLLVQNV